MSYHHQNRISQKSNKGLQKRQQITNRPVPQVKTTHPDKLIQRAKLNPNSLNADDVLTLQETIGNRAATQLLAGRSEQRVQPKLTIGEPGDKYEQEAEQVAAEVVQQMNMPASQQAGQTESIQQEEMEDEDLRLKPEANTIQPENSADDSNDQLMPGKEAVIVQCEAIPKEDELMMKPIVQLQPDGGMAATPDLEASINQTKGSGQPLADNIREPIEQAFGADFSGVKVHTDAQSDRFNQSIQARAFTTGQDIFFRRGEYNPGSRGGQELIAHELTHVVQQNGGALQRTILVQKTPIGKPPHNYTARNSNRQFVSDHLAQTVLEAQQVTLNRPNTGRATENTVLMEKDADVKKLVLAADYDAAEHLHNLVWRVPISCKYRIITAAHGANGNILRETGKQITGRVWVKVYFDEAARQISITGVWGQ